MKTMPPLQWKFAFAFLVALCLNASESWQFLPNFQFDVRGVETSSNSNADVFRHLPAAAEKLLTADSPLTDSQRNELRWRPASFPHRDFVSLMPEQKVFGWYGSCLTSPKISEVWMSWPTSASSTTRTRRWDNLHKAEARQ